ncbi:MAG: acyltransferase, partial [Bacteroidales bacterium]
MQSIDELSTNFISINSEQAFNENALALLQIHYKSNPVYRQYIDFLYPSFKPSSIEHYTQIPCLPIELFKTQKVVLDGYAPIDYFTSSGTSGSERSVHYIVNFTPYENSFLNCFSQFWGNIEEYCILALLPNYMEQQHSSLIYMVQGLMQKSQHPNNGFYLHNHQALINTLQKLEQKKQKTILFGVSYALLDLSEQFPFALNSTSILETGG